MEISIRKTLKSDLEILELIFKKAREKMRLSGNPKQWGNSHPTREDLLKDIENGHSYVVIKSSEIIGTFSFFTDKEPTYENIYQGKWLNDEKYVTIHHLASADRVPSFFKLVIDFVSQFDQDIRIDTHADNKIMLHLLAKYDFTYCGIIYLADGSERLAFQRLRKE